MAEKDATAAFIEANAALHDFLVAEADELGWNWFIRPDQRAFYVWTYDRLVTVTMLGEGRAARFEVFTDLGLCLIAPDAATAAEMLFGAMVFGDASHAEDVT